MRELWEADLRATVAQGAFPFRSYTSVKGAFSIGGVLTRVTPTCRLRRAI
jgi:hypothetical protein